MSRFRFELDGVLEMRRRVERERRAAVAEVERSRLGLEARLREVQGHVASGKRAVRDALGGGGVSIDDVRLQAQASIGWEGEARRVVIELAGVHRRLASARRLLVEASTARRSLELLRDRRFEAWRLAMRRREDAALDELATMRASRDRGA